MGDNNKRLKKALENKVKTNMPEWVKSGLDETQINSKIEELRGSLKLFFAQYGARLDGIDRTYKILNKQYGKDFATQITKFLSANIKKITNSEMTSIVIFLDKNKLIGAEGILKRVKETFEPDHQESDTKVKQEEQRLKRTLSRAPLVPLTPTSANVSRQLSTVAEGDETVESDQPSMKRQKRRA